MATDNSTILTALLDVTQRVNELSSDKQALVKDLKRISKKLVKTHIKASIFKKYEDFLSGGETEDDLDLKAD